MLRSIIQILVRTLYRLRITGEKNIPEKGPALLVANHLSLVDGFLVGTAVKRPVRFIVWKPYYEDPRWHWVMKAMKAIPVSEKDPPREILKSLLVARKALEDGELVCIFAEGEISRTGNLLEFKRGYEVIVKGLDVPIIPLLLDRLWGSIFSFEHGKAIWKWPRRIPYPVTVRFGDPLKSPSNPSQIRQAVMDLGAAAFADRLDESQSLSLEFLRQAKKHASLLAVADSSGKELSFGRLAAVSVILSRQLAKVLTPETNVGILLPSSVGGVVANVAVSLSGRVPVNLNYTAGQDMVHQCVQKAEITRLLTSRKLLEKTGLIATPSMLFVEDLIGTLSRRDIVYARVMLSVLPASFLLKRWGAKANVPLEDSAAILFSSGSTGIPKGIVLSHANILSNIQGLSQVFDLDTKDRILGILPFFHSFGFTATLWLPLIHGFGAVYHTNPLDSKTVGELTQKYKATVLIATPTFLSAYLRKCTPEQFTSLRYVITGAERLRESIAKAFEEKFHKTPLEGYGCTELSPVVAVNVPDVSMGDIRQVGHKPGKIGHPLPGVSVRIVDPDTFVLLPQGQPGLLLVKGPNVMKGYWKDPEKTKEVMREGWYVTGDMASIDPDGFLQITDRLSRFSKIGGEMVPHVLVEEKLHGLSGRSDPTFVVTSASNEQKGEELVVLYVGYDGAIDDLWKKMNESDLPKLWIPAKDRFFSIPAIPYLGTGKLNLTQVRLIAKEKLGGAL